MTVFRSDFEIWKDAGPKYIFIHRTSYTTPSEIIAGYNAIKKSSYQTMKNRYIENYKKHIHNFNDMAKLINGNLNEEKVIEKIDTSMQIALEHTCNETAQKINNDPNYLTTIANGYENFNKAFKTKDFDSFAGLMNAISQAGDLIQMGGTELIKLLSESNVQSMIDVEKLSSEVSRILSSYEGKELSLSEQKEQKLADSVNKIVGGFIGDKSIESIRPQISRIFSIEVGEPLIARLLVPIFGEGIYDILESCTGAETISLDDRTKSAINNYLSHSGVFKADIQKNNVSIDIFGNGLNAEVDLGLTVKWYKTLNGENNGSVKIAGESKSFSRRFAQVFSSIYQKYHAYNIVASSYKNKRALDELKAMLVARNLDVFLSGTNLSSKNGKVDFSQYIVINGKFYSIYKIINQALQKESGLLNGGPIEATITGEDSVVSRSKQSLGKKNNIYNAWQRIKTQNNQLENSSLTVHFYPSKLINAV